MLIGTFCCYENETYNCANATWAKFYYQQPVCFSALTKKHHMNNQSSSPHPVSPFMSARTHSCPIPSPTSCGVYESRSLPHLCGTQSREKWVWWKWKRKTDRVWFSYFPLWQVVSSIYNRTYCKHQKKMITTEWKTSRKHDGAWKTVCLKPTYQNLQVDRKYGVPYWGPTRHRPLFLCDCTSHLWVTWGLYIKKGHCHLGRPPLVRTCPV